MKSLQARLSSALIISLIVLFVAMALALERGTRHLAQAFVATRLDHDSELLKGEFKLNQRGQPVIRPRHVPPIYLRPLSGHYYRIDYGQQVLHSASQDARVFLDSANAHQDAELSEMAGPEGQYLLVLRRHFEWQGQRLSMTVAEDMSPFKHARDEFAQVFVLVAIVALLTLVLIQAWIVRRSIRPLATTRRELRALQHGELERLSLEVPDEVRPVVAEVNELLDSLNRRLERSRKVLGNLAHALKGPLTLLTELAQRRAPIGVDELQSELGREVESMRQLMERELRRARLAGQIGAGQAFIADEEIPALVNALQHIYFDKGVNIVSRMPPGLRYGMERQDLLELLGNLLDNACKWCKQRVILSLDCDQQLRLLIEDDGPGLEPDQAAGLTQRGTRLDEQTPGHGLGLAIVQDIVDGYDGSIHYQRSTELGGLQVEVLLPIRKVSELKG